MRIRYATLPLVLLGGGLLGCLTDAERGNPLDPNSENYTDTGAVVGFVTRLTSQPISDAEVHLTPLESDGELVERIARTDGAGRYSLRDVPTGSYRLTAAAPGFAPADTTVEVTLGGNAPEVTFRLDGIPAVAQAMHTERIDRWYPVDDPLYRLVVNATVSDPDGIGDIARVALVIPDFGFEDSLTAVTGGAPGEYGRVFEEDELPVPLVSLAGFPLSVEATDNSGVTGSAQGAQIVRIITVAPSGVAPVGGDTLTTLTPTLSWQAVGLSFAFTYRVQVVQRFPGFETQVWEAGGLPATQTQIQVPPNTLEPGSDYYWTVAVVDSFGNLSRSRQNGFVTPP